MCRWGAIVVGLSREGGGRRSQPAGGTGGTPTAHAEVLVLAEAARRVGSWRLLGHTLYVDAGAVLDVRGRGGLRPDRTGSCTAPPIPRRGAALSLYNISPGTGVSIISAR